MATAILLFHIISGAIGLLSGFASMVTRKGSVIHRRAGNLFFLAMSFMAIGGMLTGHIRGSVTGIFVASLALYSVATAKLTLERSEGEIGRSEYVALLYIIIAFSTTLAIGIGTDKGLLVLKDTTGEISSSGGWYFFSFIALLFASGDIRLILGKGLSGAKRIARHIGRMCFTFFFSALSFFLGQQQIFPEWVIETRLLYIPELLILFFTIFWIYRVLSEKATLVLIKPNRF
jgi:uncharacterized membrane protein